MPYALLCVSVCLTLAPDSAVSAPPQIDIYRLRTPHDAGDINQASDVCWGSIGERSGLWTCCDRNGLQTAAKIYRFSPETLRNAGSGKVMADEEFTLVPPPDWDAFSRMHGELGDERLSDLHRRLVPDADRGEEPYLDLEAIAIGPGVAVPQEARLFVVAEEPFSTILELVLPVSPNLESQISDRKPEISARATAQLVAAYAYHEPRSEQGSANNDGLEGLAFAPAGPAMSQPAKARPARVYFAEEGTRPAENARDDRLFFLDPRLGVAELTGCQVRPLADLSAALTSQVRKLSTGKSQTLNAVCPLKTGHLLVMDRNGGLILRVDPATARVSRYLNLYDLDGLDLRKLLADIPHPRRLGYISIEGLAMDDAGDLWLVDDPAIPEGFRESTLIRIRLSCWPGRPAD